MPEVLLESLLVANRGEIARRVIRTAHRLGVRTVAVYSEVDADLPFVAEADEAIAIGPAQPADSYLNADAVLAAAKQARVAAIHPGYGFLSENADFAAAVEDVGLIWVGPGAESIQAMGDKITARNLMSTAGVPVALGTPEPVADIFRALGEAQRIGYPVMVKAAAGGGGIGMSAAHNDDELRVAFDMARSRAERFFADSEILLEKYVPVARHVEVQILGLADGRVVALGERDCSVQRRHQKVAEEAPSPAVMGPLRTKLLTAAVKAGEAVGYRNAGTVEFLLDPANGDIWFLEMNTRLQVEHPITEMVTGLDLVEEQLRIASGLAPTFDPDAPPPPTGHAIEMRIYAEDPKRFLPGPGRITEWIEPVGEGVRVDSGYGPHNTVTQHYDPLLAKLIVHGKDRPEALDRARKAVREFAITGPKNNLEFFTELLDNPEFVSGAYDCKIVDRMRA